MFKDGKVHILFCVNKSEFGTKCFVKREQFVLPFIRNCLACLSLTPAIAYKASDVDAETHEGKTWYGNFNLDFLIRAGVVYNNGKYFVGTSFVGKNYNYHRNNFSLDNGFGTLQVYVGFNLNLRKEYRKKK